MNTEPSIEVSSGFESLRQINEHNVEYGRARDLQPLFGGKGAVQVVDDCHLSRFVVHASTAQGCF